ncbi:DUF3093 domain-containing protein [Actinoplanes bogorensis]|uniref:DUF3093 domain-containing protein n=1 Tax=Paractinoplanes bogorensis TaxID=1610840 RepID=A0ABS5YHZ5_9ACTN|nr:DUF3093 domain-containing protein [Actinoplanes bogorensis]MBU2662358.1 DUF3093 domain-containing protein [Actinoplanes bogorensis]
MTPESPARTTAAPAYAERLSLTWWIWPVALVVVSILAVEVLLGFPTLPTWVPFAVLIPITVAGMLWTGRIRVAVADGEFRVDDARLPVRFVKDVVALDAEGKREALGVGAHPLAFVIQRPWVGPAVQVLLDDPDDPTPYWIVSTRQPVKLATALIEARGPRG